MQITQEAAAATVALADRYVSDALAPLKAVHILTEACASQAGQRDRTQVVDVAAVTQAVADWTGLPVHEIQTPQPESLLGVLKDGIEHGGELIRVADLFPHVRARLAAKGLPEPRQRGTNTIGELALARNPKGLPEHRTGPRDLSTSA